MKTHTITLLLIISFFHLSCSKDDAPILSSEGKIISFKLNDNEFHGQIDQSTNSIVVQVNGLNLDQGITPSIQISENATISPSLSSPQNFNNEVRYTVTAENGDKTVYTVVATSNENQILSFGISLGGSTIQGAIDESSKTITLETVGLEQEDAIIPQLEISPNATISPDLSIAQNFNEEVEYKVTAKNGDETTYTVIANNVSDENMILSFSLEIEGEIYEGVIDHEELTINIEANHNVHYITPTISISEGATISPNIEIPQDFNYNVDYTITSENNTSKTYTVNTKVFKFSNSNTQLFFRNAQGIGSGTNLDLDVPNSFLILENDTNSYRLNIVKFHKDYNGTSNSVHTGFTFSFPEDIVTGSDYRLKYEVNDEIIVEADYEIDVLAENIPVVTSINHDTFSRFDTLVITGENLKDLLLIPSNGSQYIVTSRYYHININTEGTILTFIFDETDSYRLFPSYYGRDPQLKGITLLGLDYRRGPVIEVTFN